MPNWCSNSLTLTAASKEEADELHKHFENQEAEDWTFFGFFVPEEWEQGDWFWSRVEAWGTKWDASLVSVDWVDDLNVVMLFDTAWGPPIGVYNAATEQGWGVVATYYEPGMGFCGSFEHGEEEYYEYHECETPEEVRELVGENLDDEYGISDWMQQLLDEEAEENRLDGGREHLG